MLDDYGFEFYEENAFPIAYLLTFRTFGTWLHGNRKGAVQRSRDPRWRIVPVPPNVPLNKSMLSELKQPQVVLDKQQRTFVTEAIEEVCKHRKYGLHALNVRTNHTHAVISKALKPEKIVNDLKAYLTRRLRAENATPEDKVWSRGASTRYLWKPAHLDAAIEYVLYSQGDVPFSLDAETWQP
jgi:REP element-mobilizing transposase RayT